MADFAPPAHDQPSLASVLPPIIAFLGTIATGLHPGSFKPSRHGRIQTQGARGMSCHTNLASSITFVYATAMFMPHRERQRRRGDAPVVEATPSPGLPGPQHRRPRPQLVSSFLQTVCNGARTRTSVGQSVRSSIAKASSWPLSVTSGSIERACAC